MKGIFMMLLMFISVAIPMGLTVAVVFWQKRIRKREGRRSPLIDKMAHLPGQQLRQRMEVLGYGIDERVVELMMIGPFALLVLLVPRVQWASLRPTLVDYLVLAAAVAMCFWNIKRLLPLWRERLQCREGMRAEIASAQWLDRLQVQGCLVLHDIPAKDFNIDHVVISPTAVFMVETKSRRKKGEGKASANVTYDGKTLQFPGWVETKPLDQARAQARWLADYLRGETGDSTPVIPVVCLPGWFVTLGKEGSRSDVRVINPKMTSLFVDSGPRPRLENSHRNRIVTALYKTYPELELAD